MGSTPRLSEPSARPEATLLSSEDLHWFNEGTHSHLYEKLGAHPITMEGTAGTQFAVWAPTRRW